MSEPRPARRALPITDAGELRVALAGLNARERRIVELRYGIGEARAHSLPQIGRRFGITGERVRQIERRALQRLAENGGSPAPARPTGTTNGVRASEARLPRNVLQAWTLLLLRRQPAHGYDLLRRLDWPGRDGTGPRLYRLLRELEQHGLVRSSWKEGTDGPERRVYKLTRKGARQLDHDAQGLQPLLDTLQQFFEHYAEGSSECPRAKK